MWENNEYKMRFREDSILDFERAMLTSGECSDLLPMTFIGESSEQVAYYRCSGFVPINQYRVETTDDAFYILENVLIIVGRVVEYLLSPAKVTLSKDTVFYHPETGKIKIAYVPVTDGQESLRRNLLYLISQLKKDVSDGYSSYLDSFARTIHSNNYLVRELVNKVGMIRRELYSKTGPIS